MMPSLMPATPPRFGALVLYTPTPQREAKDYGVSCFLSNALPPGAILLNNKKIAENQPLVFALEKQMKRVDDALQAQMKRLADPAARALGLSRSTILDEYREKLGQAVIGPLKKIIRRLPLPAIDKQGLLQNIQNAKAPFLDVSDCPPGSASASFPSSVDSAPPASWGWMPSEERLTQAAQHLASPRRAKKDKPLSALVLRLARPEEPIGEITPEMLRKASKTLRRSRASKAARSLAGLVLRLGRKDPATATQSFSKTIPALSESSESESQAYNESHRLAVLKLANAEANIVEPPVIVDQTLDSKAAYDEYRRLDTLRLAQRVGKAVVPPVTVPNTLTSREAYSEFYRLEMIRLAQARGQKLTPPVAVPTTLSGSEANKELHRLLRQPVGEQT